MINVQNVSKTFILHQQNGVRLPVLQGASLTVNAGECVVLHGHSGSGKSTYIYEKVIQMAQADRRRNFYVIVPEQFTMQAQRELVQRSQNHVIVNIDVVSFERLAYRIFDELGIQNTVMEETGKSLVLRKIAEEKGKDLTVLRGNIRKMGYINELKSMISELMQYDISVEELEDFLGHLKPKSNLYYKLSDVHTMYAAFEEYLRGQYVTAERVLDVLADAAEESQLLKGAALCSANIDLANSVNSEC